MSRNDANGHMDHFCGSLRGANRLTDNDQKSVEVQINAQLMSKPIQRKLLNETSRRTVCRNEADLLPA